MQGVGMMAWAVGEISRVAAKCMDWFESLISKVGGLPLLYFVYFLGAVCLLIIGPIVGYTIRSTQADAVKYVKDKQSGQNKKSGG